MPAATPSPPRLAETNRSTFHWQPRVSSGRQSVVDCCATSNARPSIAWRPLSSETEFGLDWENAIDAYMPTAKAKIV
jgi:hypothetical protein